MKDEDIKDQNDLDKHLTGFTSVQLEVKRDKTTGEITSRSMSYPRAEERDRLIGLGIAKAV